MRLRELINELQFIERRLGNIVIQVATLQQGRTVYSDCEGVTFWLDHKNKTAKVVICADREEVNIESN